MNQKKKVVETFMGKNFSSLKESLTECLINRIVPIGKEMRRIKEDNSFLNSILEKGSEEATENAKKNILEIKKIIGLY